MTFVCSVSEIVLILGQGIFLLPHMSDIAAVYTILLWKRFAYKYYIYFQSKKGHKVCFLV